MLKGTDNKQCIAALFENLFLKSNLVNCFAEHHRLRTDVHSGEKHFVKCQFIRGEQV